LIRKIWIGWILLAFVIVACGREPLSDQGKSETPVAPKVNVEKEKVERGQLPPPEVKIKLKKDGKETYSWEISGSDVDQILKVNERLKKQLEGDQKGNPKFQAPNSK
jgi:hypothetical protein